jgi:putative phosphoesterase
MDEAELRAELSDRAVVEAEGVRIGLVHDAGPTVGRHERLLEWFPGCDVLAYGHSHLPEIVRRGAAWIVNPGSPTERRRAPARTMIVLEAGRPRLVELAR